jgi:hypothetical protein
MDTPMWAIEAARKGRVSMLRAIFGGSSEEPSEAPKLTPDLFKAMFAK